MTPRRSGLAWVLIVAILFQTAIFVVFYVRSIDQQDRAVCTAKLEGAAFSYAFDALSAPPVAPGALPGTKAFDESARGVAVIKGSVPAHALRDIDRSC